jgi:sulfur transfer complex TusBCD TusB component (DsrH family)
MNLIELKTILEATGYPVAYLRFYETEDQPLPQPPFIVFISAYSTNFMADNHVYKEINNIQIELYTDKKDVDAENKLATILNENELPYSTSETFIESENLYQKIYEVRLF